MNQDPKISEAFRKAIKAYFEDHDLEEYDKVQGDRKFHKKYFDSLDEDLNGPKDEVPDLKKIKKEKGKAKNAKV